MIRTRFLSCPSSWFCHEEVSVSKSGREDGHAATEERFLGLGKWETSGCKSRNGSPGHWSHSTALKDVGLDQGGWRAGATAATSGESEDDAGRRKGRGERENPSGRLSN